VPFRTELNDNLIPEFELR